MENNYANDIMNSREILEDAIIENAKDIVPLFIKALTDEKLSVNARLTAAIRIVSVVNTITKKFMYGPSSQSQASGMAEIRKTKPYSNRKQ